MTSVNTIRPGATTLSAEITVIGSGPGGAIAAARLAEAGRDVLLIEDGSHLALDSAEHFSTDEMQQKYRNGGITVGMGETKINYVEGRCVGGASEINRGLYHRTPADILENWQRSHKVEHLSIEDLHPHLETCEEIMEISPLPGEAPGLSKKLGEGASNLGWSSMEVSRMFRYATGSEAGSGKGSKRSISQTFVPMFSAAGGRLLPDCRVLRIKHSSGRWRLHMRYEPVGEKAQPLEVKTHTLFVACGAIQTPLLLRRSGFKKNIGDNLRCHPMVKIVARFDEEVNLPGQLDPIHQIKQFDPRFSMGCSISSRPVLALSMADHPGYLHEVDHDWKHMAIYYAQAPAGVAIVRPVPGFKDPLVRFHFSEQELMDLGDGLRKLAECLFAAGATVLYPSLPGSEVLSVTRGRQSELNKIPSPLPKKAANLSTVHLFSSCPMGEDESICAVNSYGKVFGADHLYITDSSTLCGPTIINPQGTVMAVAQRNIQHYLDS